MTTDTRPAAGLDLEAIEARANAATVGPWFHCQDFETHYVGYNPSKINLPLTERNADFIAHARADVPALVAEVRRLRNEVDFSHREIRKLVNVRVDLGSEVARLKAQSDDFEIKFRLADKHAAEAEREVMMLKARLEKAEAVCEADARIEVLPHREWDHSPGCPKCDAIRDRNKAREAWRAAKGEGGA